MGLLDGKVAFVTGAARGQGRAHATTLAAEGADIVAIDLERPIETVPYGTAKAEDLDQTVAEVEKLDRRIIARHADVRSAAALAAVVEEALAEFGRIDAVVANAGVFSRATLWEMDEQTWDDVIDVNLKGAWHTIKAVAPHMIERKRGSIVLTSSTNGQNGNAGAGHYVASKHGVIGLMKTAALELGPHGVRVNAVCPGLVDSPMTNWQGMYDMMAGHPGGDRSDYDRGALHYGILGGQRALPPESIANAAAWLHSDGAFGVTGQAVYIDAGHTILPGYNPAPHESRI